MENRIIETSQLPLGEKVYLKKDFLGWRVVEPVIDPETKKFVWKNFFSKKGFFNLLVIILILATLWLAFKEQIANYQAVMQNPDLFCKQYTQSITNMLSSDGNKLPIPNFSIPLI